MNESTEDSDLEVIQTLNRGVPMPHFRPINTSLRPVSHEDDFEDAFEGSAVIEVIPGPRIVLRYLLELFS